MQHDYPICLYFIIRCAIIQMSYWDDNHGKGSLIVNLSAYGGIAVERGLGLIQESLDIVRLEEEDIVKIFAASTLLMAAITRQPIDWSQRQPR